MAYESFQVICGRVASRALCYYGEDNSAMKALVSELENLDTDIVQIHERQDGDYPTYSVGWKIDELGPGSITDATNLRLVATPAEIQLAEWQLSQLPEPARGMMGEQPMGVWLVCTAS